MTEITKTDELDARLKAVESICGLNDPEYEPMTAQVIGEWLIELEERLDAMDAAAGEDNILIDWMTEVEARLDTLFAANCEMEEASDGLMSDVFDLQVSKRNDVNGNPWPFFVWLMTLTVGGFAMAAIAMVTQ